ncbi:MAG: DUF6179 domain-containing protein [bacterium]|nr:DUF6179 domain-containing protein [bacterium]
MSSYAMEELLPIVAELTAKYTRNESTSVTYETAEQLMGAVLYCIHEYHEESTYDTSVINKENTIRAMTTVKQCENARRAYEEGYQKVLKKIESVRVSYNHLIETFQAYGNVNYHDTVIKGVAGFFKLYDPRFAPQDSIITMDYPTIRPIGEMTGIDAIERYVTDISLEQSLLQALPSEWIMETLAADHMDFRTQFYNICGIVLRELLGQRKVRAWVKELPAEQTQSEQFRGELEEKLTEKLRSMVKEHCHDDQALFDYLSGALPDICVELITGYGLSV